MHFMQIAEIVHAGQNSAACRIVFQKIQNTIDLIEFALRILVLLRELIAVCLSDGTGLVCPTIPDMTGEIIYIVGFLLPDPKELIDCGLPIGSAQRHDRKLFLEVIAIYDTEEFDRMCGRTVLPMRTNVQIGVPNTFLQNFAAIVDIDFIGVTHINNLRNVTPHCGHLKYRKVLRSFHRRLS